MIVDCSVASNEQQLSFSDYSAEFTASCVVTAWCCGVGCAVQCGVNSSLISCAAPMTKFIQATNCHVVPWNFITVRQWNKHTDRRAEGQAERQLQATRRSGVVQSETRLNSRSVKVASFALTCRHDLVPTISVQLIQAFVKGNCKGNGPGTCYSRL